MNRSVRINQNEIVYELKRKQVKNINLRITREGGVMVSAGKRVPEKTIDAFVLSKAEWIVQTQKRLTAIQPRSAFDGERLMLLGETVAVRRLKGAKAGAVLQGGELILTLPRPEDEKKAKKLLEGYLSRLCEALFTKACDNCFLTFAAFGVARPQLKTRNMKSRWGSCNTKTGVITLNKRLILVPLSCIDYVVFHEFTHLIHPNHSADFYQLLSRLLPDYEKRRKQLRGFENIEL